MNIESIIHTIAFYNTENLFDVFADDKTNDNDFTPKSAKRWTKERYLKKIYKLGSVISKIGVSTSERPPAIIGLAEVENKKVLDDLINSKDLEMFDYGIVHYDSMDERGIDVALLYDKNIFEVESSEPFPVLIEESIGVRDFTRDILLVTGYLSGAKIHFIVNHWPSRHEGKDETSFKRIIAAEKVTEIISGLLSRDPNSQIIIMGDFNDNPNSPSILKLKGDNTLHNAMESVWAYNRGSANHNFAWTQFDQIFLTQNFLYPTGQNFELYAADIFDEKFLTQYDGKFKGQPYRTYVGKKYKGGFSDHFPVYIQLKKR